MFCACTLLIHCTTPHHTAPHHTTPHHTTLHRPAPHHSTAQHSTTQPNPPCSGAGALAQQTGDLSAHARACQLRMNTIEAELTALNRSVQGLAGWLTWHPMQSTNLHRPCAFFKCGQYYVSDNMFQMMWTVCFKVFGHTVVKCFGPPIKCAQCQS